MERHFSADDLIQQVRFGLKSFHYFVHIQEQAVDHLLDTDPGFLATDYKIATNVGCYLGGKRIATSDLVTVY